MNKRSGNNVSPIRRISKDEKTKQRQWPDKKHLASSHDTPLPKPGEKNRIHSVLVALPVLMLMIGLFVYFKGESAQNNGTPILSELITRDGEFKSISEVSGVGQAKYYFWYTVDGNAKGARIDAVQRDKLSGLNAGDAVALELAPRVADSKTFWVYKVHSNGALLLSPLEAMQE